MRDLEKDKFTERLDFAIELLRKRFPTAEKEHLAAFMHEAADIAMGLFVRSEIQYSQGAGKSSN